MTWNYRLFKQDTPKAADGKHIFFIGECYYDEDGKPELHSLMDHNSLVGSNAKETESTYKMIAEAFKTPIIELDAEGDFKT